MSRTTGRWNTLLQGVSQRPPELRADHHEEQVNTLADPVRGITRRPGSESVVEHPLPAMNTVDLGTWGEYRVYDWARAGLGTTRVMYRTGPGAGPAIWTHAENGDVAPYRIAGQRAGAVVEDTTVAAIDAYGVASVCGVGGFLAIAPHNHPAQITTSHSDTLPDYEKSWQSSNRIGHISLRSLSPGTRYAFRFEVVNESTGLMFASYVADYMTPVAAYPGTINTDGVTQYVNASGPRVVSSEAADFLASTFPGDGLPIARHTLAKGRFAPSGLTVTGWTNTWPARPAGPTEYAYDGSQYLYAHVSWAANAGSSGGWFYFQYEHDAVVPNPAYSSTIQRIQQAYNEAVLAWQESLANALQPSVAAWHITNGLVGATHIGLNWDSVSGGVVVVTVAAPLMNTHFLRVSVQPVLSGESRPAPGQVFIAAGTVQSVDHLPPRAWPGTTIKVQPLGSPDAFFMTAEQQGYEFGDTTALQRDVVWREGTHTKLNFFGGIVWGAMRAKNAAGAASPHNLLVGSAWGLPRGVNLVTETSVRHWRDLALQVANEDAPGTPAWAAQLAPYGPSRFPVRRVGDDRTNPRPRFIGRNISHLAAYQGRLLVCAGGVVSVSTAEDYSNFWRASSLTVRDSDPYWMASRGNEDDVIVSSALSPNGLVLAGNKALYHIPASDSMSPVNARMPVYASQTGTQGLAAFTNEVFSATSSPVGMGVLSAVPSDGGGTARVHDQGMEVLSYLRGDYRGMMVLPRPSTLLLFPSARNTVYLMSFADGQQGRVQRAWHRWYFAESCGVLLGGSIEGDRNLLLYFHRQSEDGRAFLAVDRVSLDPRTASVPYLDSWRPLTTVLAGEGCIGEDDNRPANTVFSQGPLKYVGTTLLDTGDLLIAYPGGEEPIVGFPMNTYLTLTAPHKLDREGRRVPEGNLSVSTIEASFQDTGGTWRDFSSLGGSSYIETTARLTGHSGNTIGSEPVRSYKQRFAIGRNRADYTLTLRARDWRPWGITSLNWIGTYTRRY